MQQLILLAFGFGNLVMLGWLGAAAAPILIHLWSRHRFREAPWAAMHFLLAALHKNARRLKLQQWLLLAVRTAIILLIVLAMAEPYGERLWAGGAPSHKVLVIDDSNSMDYREASETNLARAVRMAGQIVRDSRSGDVFTVIRMSGPPKIILGPGEIDHAAVAAQLASLAPSQVTADLTATLALVRESLATKQSGRTLPTQRDIIFFTDLQKQTWSALGSNQKLDGDDATRATTSDASLTVVDIGQPNATNLAISGLSSADEFVTLHRKISFDATLHQFGAEPRPQCKVEFLVDDIPAAEQSVDVPAGGDATVRFNYHFEKQGSHTICVRAAGDRLELDNVRWLVVPVREEVRVLCVAGREGAAKHLADALDPSPGNSAFRPVVVSEGDFADVTLAEFDCIFLSNVAQLTASEAGRLVRYAKAGGGVVLFLGDRVDPNSYNAIGSSSQLLPAHLGEVVAKPQFGLDPLEYKHPIVAPFRARERAGLLTTPVSRYYHLDVTKDRVNIETAAALPNGDPFIVTASIGRGRVVMVATDASLSSVDPQTGDPWTTWPTWPSFLPIVRELLAFAAGGEHDRWQQAIGTPLAARGIAATGVADLSVLQIVRPDGRKAAVNVESTASGTEWNYDNTDLCGIYTLIGMPGGQSQQFAVNLNTGESDLAKVDVKELPEKLVVRSTWQDSHSTNSDEFLAHSNWGASILWSVLALMLVESFMAWYFGRGAV